MNLEDFPIRVTVDGVIQCGAIDDDTTDGERVSVVFGDSLERETTFGELLHVIRRHMEDHGENVA